MPDEAPKIIVDSDWKAEAQREKERIQEKVEHQAPQAIPDPSFPELLEIIVMQALVGLGLMGGGPRGERIPPQPEIAKHYIDMIELLGNKTKGNLAAEEKKMVEDALYELRLRYVSLVSGQPMGPSSEAAPAK